jgi:hypothetical protein
MTSFLRRGAVVVALCLLAIVYGCDAGHGFVKDDFVWIASSRVESPRDLVRLIAPAAAGFFRPVVSLTFAIDHAIFGLDPLGYGLTNVALLFACVGLLTVLLHALGLRRGVAIAGALVWALNFQAVNMAVLWISGRTALVLVLWALAAAYAWLRGHRLRAAACAMLAMWSKEEGFVIPAILSVWSIIDSRAAALPLWARLRRTLAETWMLWVAAAVSLVVRASSGAWTPASAPSFYRYRFDVSTFLGHTYQYADRAATTPVLVFVLFWLVAGCPRLRPGTDGTRWMKGASWLVLGFVPTLLLPVRSSLYALFPSIGVVLVLGDLVEGAASRLSQRAVNRAIAFLILLLLALFPVYKVRNRRYVREAELSADVMREAVKIAGERGGRTAVVIKDVRDARPTAEQALGGLADEAGALMTGGRVRLWIEPPPVDLAGGVAPAPSEISAVLLVKSGQVTRIQ